MTYIDPSDVDVSNVGPVTSTPDYTIRTEPSERVNNFTNIATLAVPGIIAGLVDTFGSSVGLTDENQLYDWLKGKVGQSGALFLAENYEALKTTGDVAGMLIPGLSAAKLIQGGGWVSRSLGALTNNNRWAQSVFTTGKNMEQIFAPVRAHDVLLAQQGFQDLAYGSAASKTLINGVSKQQLVNRAFTERLTDTLKENIAFEAGVALTMNSSDTLYPEDWSWKEYALLNVPLPATMAAVDTLVMRKQLRQSAQSVANLAADVNNPAGIDQQIFRFTPSNEVGIGDRSLGITGYARSIKALELGAQEAKQQGKDVLFNNLHQKATDEQGVLRNQIGEMAKDKPLDAKLTKSWKMPQAAEKTFIDFLNDAPEGALGGISLERTRTSFDIDAAWTTKKTEVLESGEKEIAKWQDELAALPEDDIKTRMELGNSISQRQDELRFLRGTTAQVVDIDGSLVPELLYRPGIETMDDVKINSIRRSELEPRKYQIKHQDIFNPGRANPTFDFEVDETFLTLGKHRYDENVFTRSVEQRLHRRMLDSYFDRPGGSKAAEVFNSEALRPGTRIVLNEKSDWMQLESVDELLRRSDGQARSIVQIPDEWNGNYDLIREFAIVKKFAEFNKLRDRMDNQLASRVSATKRINIYDIQKMLNLPAARDGDIHPMTQVFEAFRLQGDKDLHELLARGRVEQQLKEAMVHFAKFPEIGQYMGREELEIATVGQRLKLNYDKQPVTIVRREINQNHFTKEAFENASMAEYMRVLDVMGSAANEGANIVARTFNELQGRGLTEQAKQAQTVMGGAQRGKGIITQQAFAAGENPAVQAAHQLQGITDRAAVHEVDAVMKPYSETITKFRSRNNNADLVSLGLYRQSRAMGWDLKPGFTTVDGANGKTGYGFYLENNNHNRQLYHRIFGEEMPENALMPAVRPDRTYEPLHVTELAFEGATAFNALSHHILKELNLLRKAMGLDPINKKEWHVLPKSLYAQEVAYLIREDGALKTAVVGYSKADLDRQIAKIRELDEFKGSKVVTKDEVARYYHMQDEVFSKSLDYGDALAQTGARSTGALSNPLLETGEDWLNLLVQGYQNQLLGIARRARMLYFQPQLNFAKLAEMTNGAKGTENSIWSNYRNAITGGSPLAYNSRIGKLYQTIESTYDSVLQGLHDKLIDSGVVTGLNFGEKLRRFGLGDEEKEFNSLKAQLGDWLPYEKSVEFAQRVSERALPPTMKKHAATFNNVTTALTLRMFELGHPILNITGFAATMPAVVRVLNKLPGETDQKQFERIVGFSDRLGNKNPIPVFSATKSAMSALQFAFSAEGKQLLQQASREGWFDQQVAESLRIMSAPQKSWAETMISRGVDAVSIMTDKSEQFVRGMAWLQGYLIGKNGLGLDNSKDAFAFAHKFANDIIGDYRPTNRPQMFQGAVGMPLGLFQTYAWNYYQRLFGYIENRQHKALAVQYAMQASVFGAVSTPGFDVYNSLFFTGASGQQNIVDGFEQRFGAGIADVVLYGSLSNAPKIFGADGVALYQRGDANMRNIPGLWNLDQTPAFDMARHTIKAIGDVFDMFSTGYSNQQMMEIASVHAINRPIKNMFELAAGYSVDNRYNLISDDVRNSLSVAARIVGSKPMSEAKAREALYKDRVEESRQKSIMADTLEATKAAFRGGEIDENKLQKVISNYMRAGGRVENFPTWLRNTAAVALSTNAERRFSELLTDPRANYKLLRLMNTGALNQIDFEPVVNEQGVQP